MPSVVPRATAPFPFLSLACDAGRRLGAVGVLVIAEGPMDWDVVRVSSTSELPILVASDSQRQIEAIRKSGLVAIEVEPSEVSISERISLALIEAVANDLLQGGRPGRGGLLRVRGRGAGLADGDPAGGAPRAADRARSAGTRDLGSVRDARRLWSTRRSRLDAKGARESRWDS